MKNHTIHDINSMDTTTSVKTENIAVVRLIETVLIEKQVKRNCRQIAIGLLMRAHIEQQSQELLTLFSDGTDQNNVSAIANWIYVLNPSQFSANTDDVSKYLYKFYNHLSKHGIDVDY